MSDMADAADAGDVVFQRGQDGSEVEDIWDDTALIKAYDEAVSVMKTKVAEQNGTAVSSDHDVVPSVHLKKQKKKKAKNKGKRRHWNVGDRCRATFSEDGLMYAAELLSVDEAAGTCFVRYTDYGNEEEHNLSDLLLAHPRHKHAKGSDVETDSGVEQRSDKRSRVHRMSSRSDDHKSHASPWPGYLGDMMPPPPPPAPAFPSGLPGGYPGSLPGMFPPPPPQSGMQSRIPTIPPPPPPMLGDLSEGDNEALCSMLMSWYMSGYHTGYYQGLQHGRRASGATSPYVNR